MKNDRIDLRVPAATKDRWKGEAEDLGLDLTSLITRAVEAYLRERDDCARAAA